MKEITEKEYEQFQILKKIWAHVQVEKSGAYFICGEGGSKDEMGLPEFISICPAYGADFRCTTTYKKENKRSYT